MVTEGSEFKNRDKGDKSKKEGESPDLEPEEPNFDDEDYGGLPNRDLKKNLGCG